MGAGETQTLLVKKSNRLDKAIASSLPELSRSAAQKLIDQGRVTVNGATRDASHFVRAGDAIIVRLPPPEFTVPQAEDIPLVLLYEDDDVIAIDKPAGTVVHPGAGNASGTLVNALLSRLPGIALVGDAQRPGIVHRLDKETSGIVLVAKTDAAHRRLQLQFKTRKIKKTYWAMCIGDMQPASGVIDKPIGRDPSHRQRMAIVAGGREAITQYRVMELTHYEDRAYSWVKAFPLTGRTHQIRVHFASLGFPIVGDLLYGAKRDPLSKRIAPRHLLHAGELQFEHPTSGATIKLHSPLPPDMQLYFVID